MIFILNKILFKLINYFYSHQIHLMSKLVAWLTWQILRMLRSKMMPMTRVLVPNLTQKLTNEMKMKKCKLFIYLIIIIK